MRRLLLLTASVLSQLSDDEDFEGSGEASGDFITNYSENPEIRSDKSPSEASLFDHFVNKKFLAAVIAGSCVGKFKDKQRVRFITGIDGDDAGPV
ncbi:Oidioi.mRNA.OKI2018_I69.chr2.g7636.t1.cds [Oikopleura dioica]|uniref:Oidioi.mRNA.OKI2018_I69.chr2.g7636.t1.cds n=1 Tax=Oikopleura dioica TaxID=34765 RepID=A0ABN7T7A3_OIKDI|nr:Oidioi.mRNA.OKI2018_I69.chr2.g7636.t1.cds [Oikopleura dioica]